MSASKRPQTHHGPLQRLLGVAPNPALPQIQEQRKATTDANHASSRNRQPKHSYFTPRPLTENEDEQNQSRNDCVQPEECADVTKKQLREEQSHVQTVLSEPW